MLDFASAAKLEVLIAPGFAAAACETSLAPSRRLPMSLLVAAVTNVGSVNTCDVNRFTTLSMGT